MTYTPTIWIDYNVPCIEATTLNNAEAGIDRAQGDVMVRFGTTALIPASDPLLVGRLYFESDLLRRGWRDNGAGWDQVTVAPPYTSLLLKTGQTTAYSVFDDGDQEIGVASGYTVNAIAGNTDIQVAHYAGNQIGFAGVGTDEIQDGAGGLVTFLLNDRVVVKGSLLNDGVTFTVTVAGVAGHFHVAPNIVPEAAGRMISLYKVAAHSNAVVTDNKTGRMWSRNTSTGERVGVLSNGTLNWYDVATRYAIYNVANTVSCIMPGNIFRVIGGAALTQFHVGDCIQVAGFANPVNGLPNYYVVSAVANAGNLDITVNPGNEVLIAEGAVGDAIYLVCRSIYNYMAGARLAGLSGYTDWRIPNKPEGLSLMDDEAPSVYPNAVAFPVWPRIVWSSTTSANVTTAATRFDYLGAFDATGQAKSSVANNPCVALVRN